MLNNFDAVQYLKDNYKHLLCKENLVLEMLMKNSDVVDFEEVDDELVNSSMKIGVGCKLNIDHNTSINQIKRKINQTMKCLGIAITDFVINGENNEPNEINGLLELLQGKKFNIDDFNIRDFKDFEDYYLITSKQQLMYTKSCCRCMYFTDINTLILPKQVEFKNRCNFILIKKYEFKLRELFFPKIYLSIKEPLVCDELLNEEININTVKVYDDSNLSLVMLNGIVLSRDVNKFSKSCYYIS